MENLIRQTAIKWWRDMSMIDQSFITQKYSTLLYGRGASSLTSREIEMLYLKEHPTEAEVSKEEETVEQYAKNYLKKLDDESGNMWTEDNEGIVKSFVHMANWQKEQDSVLIKDLLEIVNVLSATINPDDYTREFKSKVRNSITKAEQHIKK